jgi:alcohol dehydrogenase class IV
VVHGFAAAIGGMFDAPHGCICAAILSHGIAANLRALQQRAPESPALERYHEAAQLTSGESRASAADLVVWVTNLTKNLHIPGLNAWGISEQHVDAIVERAARASSMKANPLPLTNSELAQIVLNAL